jgi:hypothetical protein
MACITRSLSQGVRRGKAQGVLTSEELEMVTFTAEGIGRIIPYGVRWRGAVEGRKNNQIQKILRKSIFTTGDKIDG